MISNNLLVIKLNNSLNNSVGMWYVCKILIIGCWCDTLMGLIGAPERGFVIHGYLVEFVVCM